MMYSQNLQQTLADGVGDVRIAQHLRHELKQYTVSALLHLQLVLGELREAAPVD